MVVLDTDIVISALKGDETAARKIQHCEASCITSLTAFELLRGISLAKDAERKRAQLIQAISSFYVLDFTYLEADAAAQIDAELARKGSPIGTIDTFIAASCVVANQQLVTRNVKHFQKVKGLKIEKW